MGPRDRRGPRTPPKPSRMLLGLGKACSSYKDSKCSLHTPTLFVRCLNCLRRHLGALVISTAVALLGRSFSVRVGVITSHRSEKLSLSPDRGRILAETPFLKKPLSGHPRLRSLSPPLSRQLRLSLPASGLLLRPASETDVSQGSDSYKSATSPFFSPPLFSHQGLHSISCTSCAP